MAATATEQTDGASLRPDHQITTLDSGVRVVTERVPGVRSVALGFWIATGSAAEREQEAGISHLLEHMLFRGTERYASEEIDQIFDAMGAEINAGTDKEATSLYTRVLDGHLEQAFDVMSDMIWHPRFGELEAEREVVLEEIAMYEDDPQDRVFDILGRAIFGAHPLGRPVIGRADVVAGVDREQLAAFHAERYRPPVIVIAAAGSLDHEQIVADGGRDRPRRRRRAALPGPLRADPRTGLHPANATSWRKTPSSTTCASGAPASPATTSAASRCGCSKACSAEPPHRGCSRRSASAAVWPTRSSPSPTCMRTPARSGCTWAPARRTSSRRLQVVAGELARCVEDPASEQELIRSRENLKGRVVLGLESTGARMSRLGASVMHDMPILSIGDVIERIDAVAMDDVRELAAELFAAERLSIAGVGPDLAAFTAAIAPLRTEQPAGASGAAL